jgi:hypothetical protein
MPDPVIEILHKDWQHPVELTRDEATELMKELKAFLDSSGPHVTVKNSAGRVYKATRIRQVS